MPQWNLIAQKTYSGNIAAGASKNDGLTGDESQTKVVSGVLQPAVAGSTDLLRYLATADSNKPHRITIYCAPIPAITGTSPQDLATIGAFDLYDPASGLPSYVGALARNSNNGGSNNGFRVGLLQGSVLYSENASNPASFTPSGSGTLVFATSTAGRYGTGNKTVDGAASYTDTNGAHNATLTGENRIDGGGKPGIFLKGAEIPNGFGVTGWQIEEYGEPAATPLTVAAGMGIPTASGATIAATGPQVSGGAAGAAITYAWQYTETKDGTGTAIAGQSGTVAAGTTQIPNLSWTVPSGLQNKVLYLFCNVGDGATTINGVGRSSVYTGVGANGVYAASSVPAPTIPNNAALTAVFNPATGIASGKAILLLLGDSITEQGIAAHQGVWANGSGIGGGEVTVINAGHSGTGFADWLPGASTSGAGRSRINGVDASSAINNYNGAVAAAQAAYVSGDAVIVSMALGINSLLDSQGTTRFDSIVSSLQTDIAAFAGNKWRIVVQDLPVQRRLNEQYNSFLGQIDTYPAYFFAAGDASGTDKVLTGTRLSRRFFAARQDLLKEGLHPDMQTDGSFTGSTTEGRDGLARLQAAGMLPAMSEIYTPSLTITQSAPFTVTPTFPAQSVSIASVLPKTITQSAPFVLGQTFPPQSVFVGTTPPGPGDYDPAPITGSPVWTAYNQSGNKFVAAERRRLILSLTGSGGAQRMLDNTAYPTEIALIPFHVGQYPDGNTVWTEAERNTDGTVSIVVGPDDVPLTKGYTYRIFVRVNCNDELPEFLVSGPNYCLQAV